MVRARPEAQNESEDEHWMRRALALASRAGGETSPNPMVGCVLVRAGRVVSEAWHARAGQPHAEVLALRQAGARARGATAYVTLEPCTHYGRTPPCAPQLVAARVARVVAAMRDPNPAVNGRGLALLKRAGIHMTSGVLAAEAVSLNERFIVAVRQRRPFVMLKAAMTLDGRIATHSGDSKWITSPAQRRQARFLRRLHDGIVVGVGTVLADDPALLPAPRLRRPFHRIVIDTHLRTPPASRLVRSVDKGPVWIVCGPVPPARRRALVGAGVRVISLARTSRARPRGLAQRGTPGRMPVRHVVDRLWQEGITSLMVEGGAEVLGAFLHARLLDQVVLFRAPLLLGGRRSLGAFGGPDPLRMAQALALSARNPLARAGRVQPLSLALAGEPPLFEVWYPR